MAGEERSISRDFREEEADDAKIGICIVGLNCFTTTA
jgi:hypothetical protein